MAKTLKDQLYQALRQGIDNGHLEPGLVLLEGNIAEIFGMSRSPVRQTLGRLHEDRVICRFDGRGYLVGAAPGEVVRRNLSKLDFRPLGEDVKIERTDSWRTIAEQVERDVVLCSMKGKFDLNELRLARTFSVSRTITHQILHHLQAIGVVEKVKYSSWSVVPLDNERLRNLYEARRQLEPFMIARASMSLAEQDIVHYMEKLELAARRYPAVESALLDELEDDLHHKVISQAGNQEIVNMLRRTRPVLLISKHLLGSSIELPQQDPFFEDHLRVFETMRERRPELASQALREHLQSSESTVLERLAQFRGEGHIEMPGYLRRAEK